MLIVPYTMSVAREPPGNLKAPHCTYEAIPVIRKEQGCSHHIMAEQTGSMRTKTPIVTEVEGTTIARTTASR